MLWPSGILQTLFEDACLEKNKTAESCFRLVLLGKMWLILQEESQEKDDENSWRKGSSTNVETFQRILSLEGRAKGNWTEMVTM